MNEIEKAIAEIHHDLNGLRQELKNHVIQSANNRDELDSRIERLIYLLEGDKSDPERGFISRIKNIEAFVATIKDTKTYLMGNIAAAIFIITAIGGVISGLIKLYTFLNNHK